MASRTTNERVARLRLRQRRQRVALDAVAAAQGVVEVARARRAARVAELDRLVVEAERGFDVALLVLASVMPVEEAALVAGVDVGVFRAARRRVGVQEVRAAVARLGVGGGRRGRVGDGVGAVGAGGD